MKAITKKNLFKIGFRFIDDQHVFYTSSDGDKRLSIYFEDKSFFLIALDRYNEKLSEDEGGFEEVIHLDNCRTLSDILNLTRIL